LSCGAGSQSFARSLWALYLKHRLVNSFLCSPDQKEEILKRIEFPRDRNVLLVSLLVCVCVGLALLPTGFEERLPKDTHLARAKVISVDNADIERAMIVKTGTQRLTVEVLEGPFKGKEVTASNLLTGKMELDEIYAQDETILLELSARDGKIGWAHPRGYYRLGFELMLLALFALLLVAAAGWTGFKALLSFIFSALMIWKVMVPCFLKGYDPILVSLAVVGGLIAVVSILAGGAGRKGLVAFTGAIAGLMLTYVLALLFAKGFRVHGAVRPFAETVLYSGFYHLDLTAIFLAGIFTASSGAVMDLAMDISASMHEVYEKHPAISRREHIASGMAVARSVIGPMTTTLLLAYSGSYTTMLMLFMGQGIPMANIFNLNLVAAEVLNTCVGSFGLVAVAPLTAIAGGFVYSWNPLKKSRLGVDASREHYLQ
jgi:uncharacterized membrane protein